MEGLTMAGKKKGRIAVPYIITIFISLLIIGGAALFIYNYFELGKEDELPELMSRTSSEITYDDSHTVLLILDTPEDSSPQTFMLMHSVPVDKTLMLVGIPANTVGSVSGKQKQLSEVYESGGAMETVDFLEQIFSVDISRYMIFDSDAFIELTDIFGGVTYTLDVKVPGVGEAGVEKILNGMQIERYITYALFPDGEMQRAFNTGAILAAMVNQSDGQRIADNFDMYFNTIIDMVETNVTAVNYKNYSTAIKYMFEKGTAVAKYSYMTGSTVGDDFYADADFCESLKEEYFTAPEPETETDSQSAGDDTEE